jgi:hypothetical protein
MLGLISGSKAASFSASLAEAYRVDTALAEAYCAGTATLAEAYRLAGKCCFGAL